MRPHQSLDMAFPASRFTKATVSPLELRVPARQGLAQPEQTAMPLTVAEPAVTAEAGPERFPVALEVDRIVPPSGNLQLGSQQVWLGPALAGRTITLWVDETSLHVLMDGTRLKTLPSRLGVTELARLAASGARPAGHRPSRPGMAPQSKSSARSMRLAWLALPVAR